MRNHPIGVFDSGLDGLTTVREIQRIMPGEDIIYFGDTGRVPYGNRSRETIIRYTKDDIDFLLRHDIKLIIAACGTASSVALPVLQDRYDIKSGKYTELINSLNPDARVFSNACPMFVPLVENGYAASEAAKLIARDYLMPLKNAKVDTLILGCTHYPLLTDVITDIMGVEVTLLSPGALAAEEAKSFLEKNQLLSEKDSGNSTFFVSDSVENFTSLGSTFLGKPIESKVHLAEVSD